MTPKPTPRAAQRVLIGRSLVPRKRRSKAAAKMPVPNKVVNHESQIGPYSALVNISTMAFPCV